MTSLGTAGKSTTPDLSAHSTLASRALRTPLPPWATLDARTLAGAVTTEMSVCDNDELAELLFRLARRRHPRASVELRHAMTGAAMRLLRGADVLVRMRLLAGGTYGSVPGHHSRWQPRGLDGRFRRTDVLPPAPFMSDETAVVLIGWEHEQDQLTQRLAA
jgi:hypothetical protein